MHFRIQRLKDEPCRRRLFDSPGMPELPVSVATLLIAAEKTAGGESNRGDRQECDCFQAASHALYSGTIEELTDGQLLERFATGRGVGAELAFAALIERHGAMVLRVCRGILGDPHDSEDAFQATFLILVKKARGLWVRDSLGPWLHQVAYRTASCARQAGLRRNQHERRAAVLRNEVHFDVYGDDLACVLHAEIERLPERFRAPLVLCDLEGRSHEQAARHLGWPVGTVKSRQARARERLRERLRRRGVAPHTEVLAVALRPDRVSAVIHPGLADSTIKAAIQIVAVRAIVPGTVVSLAQGVLRSMSISQCLKAASVLFVLGATTSGVGLLAQKGTHVARSAGGSAPGRKREQPSSMAVTPGKLSVTVVEKGRLETSRNADAYSPIEGQTTIIQIVPEGTPVKNGQIVCELDSARLKDQLINQRITMKAAEANYENAKIAREVAEIAVVEYSDGIYKSEMKILKDAGTAAQSAIDKADTRLGRTRLARKRVHDILATKGTPSAPADIVAELDIEDRLESAELTLLRERLMLDQAKNRQDLLEKITRPRTVRELKDDVERKRSAELAKKATWELGDQ